MRRLLVVCAGVLSALALGCAESPAPEAPLLQLTQELRLDADTEDFSAVGRIYVGPRREIVVPLRQDMQIRIYDSTGARIAAIGRQGEGPGEFRSLGLVGWVADTLWVYDIRIQRLTFVSPAGEYLRSVSLPWAMSGDTITGAGVTGRMGFASPLALFTDGTMLAEARLMPLNEQQPDSDWPARVFVLATFDGDARLVQQPPAYEDERWFMTVAGFGRDIPFAGQPLFAATSDGQRFAHLVTEVTSSEGGTYTLSMFNGSGDTAFVRSYPFRGVPIPQSAADSAIEAERNTGGREGPSDLNERFARVARERMPPVYAPVQAMVLGLDGTTWLTLRDSDEGRVVLVLDATGDVIGRVVLPEGATLRQAIRSQIWVTQADADGLVSVVRYRVQLGA
ncbi:MAG TPA: hypothetical protein VF178_11850 [Gemmatimonadaceae bacterium]